jgi:outer membrane usher protein
MRRYRTTDATAWCVALLAVLAALPARAQSFEPVWIAVHASVIAAAEESLLMRASDGSLWASEDDLRTWGVAPSGASETVETQRWYALNAQRGVSSRFDAAEQSLWLDVDPGLRAIQVRGVQMAEDQVEAESTEPGGWVDLDLQGTHASHSDLLGGIVDGRVFNHYGFGSAGLFFQDTRAVRLGTTWTIDRPDDLERIDFGDGIHDGRSLGRAVRFGGASAGTDFSLQPDLVTFPVPDLRGVARLPSTLDIYVNGMLARRESVDSGPFVITNMPATTGQGEAQVVVRDLLGREQVVRQPFYASMRLLRPGLSDWRVDGGWLREDYGFRSNRYGEGFVAGRRRTGINTRLTLEGSTEVTRSRIAGGGTAAFAAPYGGIAYVALGAADGEAGAGGRAETGFDFDRGGYGRNSWSFGARMHRSTARWTDLGEAKPSHDRGASANFSMGLWSGGSAGLTWSRSDTTEQAPVDVLALDVSTRALPGWYVTGNVARIHVERADWFAGISLIGLWGGGTTIAETRRDEGRDLQRLEWQSNVQDELDDRYRLRAQTGSDPREVAEAAWTGLRGGVTVGVDHDERDTTYRAGTTTRLAWLGSDLFWTRPGPGGFAVIDAGGLAGVGVLQEHRLAAKTDDRGLALLPRLLPSQRTTVGRVDADIPIEADVDTLEQVIVPEQRGGVRIAFPVRAQGGSGVRLVMPDGSPLPFGASVRDPMTNVTLPLAVDGTAWWALGEMPSTLSVNIPGRQCVAHPHTAGTGTVPIECGS